MTTKSHTFLPFAKPCLSDAAIQEVVETLKSGWITTGPRVKKFEKDLEAYLSAPHVDCLSSATAGLHVALLSLDLKPGDEVITTSFTFIATFNTIVQAGGIPVPVDVDRHTYNIDCDLLEKAITKKTKAIVPVHFGGAPVDLDRIYEIAKKHQLRVIEDAAHAIGTEYKNKKVGSFGDTQVFSFHPNKTMTTGEGGAISSHHKETIDFIQMARFHGINREAWNRFSKEGSQLYDVRLAGFKYNMMDIQAALGIHQLKDLDYFIEQRQKRVAIYQKELKDIPALTLPQTPSYAHKHAWHLYAPTLDPKIAGFSRNTLIEKMKENNIGVGLHWQAPHLFSFYQEHFGFKEGDCPIAETIADHIFSLPLFPQMTDDDQNRVIDVLKKVLK